jgi:hypothetical protein
MSFKIKNRKKKTVDKRTTIDAKHNSIIKKFKDEKKQLPTLRKEYRKLKKNYDKLMLKSLKEFTDEEFEKKDDMEDKMEELENKISNLENSVEEKNYYLNTSNLLFDYYDNSLSSKVVDEKCKKTKSQKTVMDWLNKNQTNTENVRRKVCDNYLSIIDPNFVKTYEKQELQNSYCETCGIEMTTHLSEGCMICTKCGVVSYIVIDSDKPSYKDPPQEISYFAYKRINHFNEWLAQFQAKETTDIPQELYDQILLEIKKERIDNMRDLKQSKVREILKKLKQNKYYEHVPHIINKINGLPPPIMSRETEEELRRMFKEIQIPFQKFCPKDRKNFLSYSYVLHKFVQLLDLDEYLDCFILLKSREKLHQQDLIWSQICKYLKWEFIPSV